MAQTKGSRIATHKRGMGPQEARRNRGQVTFSCERLQVGRGPGRRARGNPGPNRFENPSSTCDDNELQHQSWRL
eukprot:4421028-Pyramimonas_sp.AAC.1